MIDQKGKPITKKYTASELSNLTHTPLYQHINYLKLMTFWQNEKPILSGTHSKSEYKL